MNHGYNHRNNHGYKFHKGLSYRNHHGNQLWWKKRLGNYVPLVTRYVTVATRNVIYSTYGKETLQDLHRIQFK